MIGDIQSPSLPHYSCAWAQITALLQVLCIPALDLSHGCRRSPIKGRDDEQGCVFSLSSLLVGGGAAPASEHCLQPVICKGDLEDLGNPRQEPFLWEWRRR